MAKTRYLRLPFSFDTGRLTEDLARIGEEEWIAHANTGAYDRDWRCVPLRSVEGRKDHILALPGMRYADTDILARCPYFREVLDSFACDKTSVRLMSMGAGSQIMPHRDSGTCFEDGMARLHVPIATTPEVRFTVDGEEVHFAAGHAWYLNAKCLHSVRNDGRQARIHLMLDCAVNSWLEAAFAEAGFEADEPPKYGDPAITDENVDAVIALLRAQATETGRQLAEALAKAQATGRAA